MDPQITITYRHPKGQFISRDQTKVVLAKNYNRVPLPDGKEETIAAVWKSRLKANSTLFNGTKFRVASVHCDEHSGSTIFHLGITCYKDFIGTNWSPDANALRQLGKKLCNNSQIFMSDPLGVGAFVQTSDDYVVLLKRSCDCGEAPGLWDVPGGHAEPKELVGKVDISEIDVGKLQADAVRDEVFNSILREIEDETNIALEYLTDPQLIGVARNTTSAGRPSLEFFVRCSQTSSEVIKLYHQGSQAEADESTSIKLIPLQQVMTLQEHDQHLWNNMAPSAKGCLTLYGLTMNVRSH